MTNKREELEEKKLLIPKEFRTNLSATTAIYNFCFKIIEQVSLRKQVRLDLSVLSTKLAVECSDPEANQF